MPSSAPTAFRTPLESATLARVAWLIGMRWLFVLGLALGGTIGHAALTGLPLLPFLVLALLAAVFNTIAHLLNARVAALPEERKRPLVQALIQGQVLGDWLILLGVIHYTGGIESPLLHFFIFHLALSAVFLRPGFTWLALGLIATALGLLFTAEATGLLTPVVLDGLSDPVKQRSLRHIVHFTFWYFSTLAVMTLLLGSVMRGLRRREAEALRMRRRLEQANQDILHNSNERIRLMHTMGHELRSPLAAAQSMLSALELSQGRDLPEAVRGIHRRISARLQGLIGLIGELLELAEQRRSQGSAGGPRRRVELAPLLEGLLEDQAERARAAGLVLVRTWDEDPGLATGGDPDHLRRVFENLLSNAIKYSRQGGTVRVGLVAAAGGEGEAPQVVETTVADEGIGIAPDQLPRLFSEFYRTPQSRRHTSEGTGLGLAITRDLVEAAGGRILVESVLEQGSTFRVRLPRLD